MQYLEFPVFTIYNTLAERIVKTQPVQEHSVLKTRYIGLNK